MVTDFLEQLILLFNKVPKLTKVLNCERAPVALEDGEVQLLQRIKIALFK